MIDRKGYQRDGDKVVEVDKLTSTDQRDSGHGILGLGVAEHEQNDGHHPQKVN